MKLFIHGVPDTPLIWSPLIDALGRPSDCRALELPGLSRDPPDGFKFTPDAYVAWLIDQIEQTAARTGPVDLVGHDWGALFAVRVACLRPDLVRTWAAANAVPDPSDPWPLVARLWGTPILGKLLISIAPSHEVERQLKQQKLSEGLAAHEAAHWKRQTRRAIHRLYRSGLKVGAKWDDGLDALSSRGLIIWGKDDPYTKDETAKTFCKRTGARLALLDGCGHWSIVECAEKIADELKTHWAG